MAVRDPDSQLVRDLTAGNGPQRRAALGKLYERYSRRVFNVAWRVTGDWNRAQDVTQDVFLTLRDRVGSWRGEASLGSWLYRLAVNRAIDHRRRERRRPAWRMGDGPLDETARRPRGGDASEVPEDPLEREGEKGAVHRALRRLSPKLRAILVLRYLEGLSYEDLASVLACSLGTVKSRLSRAHAAFREAIEAEGGADLW